MKKNGIFAVALMAAGLLVSCGNKANENGWYEDFDAAKKAAGSDKAVVLCVATDRDPEETLKGLKAITETPEFAKKVSDSFVCCFFNFTQEAADATKYEGNATYKEQKTAVAKKAAFDKMLRVAGSYGIQNTPTMVLVSGEGYWINSMSIGFENDSVDGFVSALKLYSDDVAEMKNMVAATKTGSNLDKVKAIDKLFNSQPEVCQTVMKSLVKKVPSLDKNNTSGLVSKYIVAGANIDAYEKILAKDIAGAAATMKKAAESPVIDSKDAQMLYYYAAQTLAQSESNDFDQILGLLNSAIEVAPDSPYNEDLKGIMEYIQSVKSQYEAENSAASETSSEEVGESKTEEKSESEVESKVEAAN